MPRVRAPHIIVSTIAAAITYGTVAYATDAPPFPINDKRPIVSEEVCRPFIDDHQSFVALQEALPPAEKYSSDASGNTTRQYGDSLWQNDCAIYGDGDLLLSGSAEMGNWASPLAWVRDRRGEYFDDESGPQYQFQSGLASRAGEETAEILLPCVPPGEIPGGRYQLSVVVHAHAALQGPAEDRRMALARLARGLAEHMHAQARCTEPADLPTDVRTLRPS
jgi:hypothetical protein